MAVETFNFTTGPASLPDLGSLAYNGCTFSPLFHTEVSGKIVKDNANRTTKLMEYKLTVEGYVTASGAAAGGNSIGIVASIDIMRSLLQAQGEALTYSGRGFNLLPTTLEVAWGPVPELLEFQPLGGGNSAKVKWEVTFRTPEAPKGTHFPRGSGTAKDFPLLQFNYETVLTYGEDYYSSMVIKGTMEILMNRALSTVNGRKLNTTIDDVRTELDRRIFSGIDLSRFYVTKREYKVARDKRTMEFDVQVDEKPYMDMPENCSVARGSYNVRPAKSGPGLVLWMCTLRATYTVRADYPRRWAWDAFLLLLKLRMYYSRLANKTAPGIRQPQQQQVQQNPQQPERTWFGFARDIAGAVTGGAMGAQGLRNFNQAARQVIEGRVNNDVLPGAWLIDFSFDEPLYKDSKTVTFSATWRLVTTLSHILLASGIWKKVPEKSVIGNNLWALSMADVSGARGVMPNVLDPSKDIIIDFGY